MNGTYLWNKHRYPVQSSKIEPCTSQPLKSKPVLMQIPTNIRAVKEAEKFHPRGRTIVVCLDGTGDKFDGDNSNIVHLVSCLKKDDNSQFTYYQAGLGTYSGNELSSGISAALDMAVGSLLGHHVRDAYSFLMHTYKEGDKICIFGFSRGAYTARCLAGMVHKVGLLPPRNIAQIPFAYDMYRNDSVEGWQRSDDFKETFCMDVSVYLLGLFDAVASVGFIPRELPFSNTRKSKCHYFRHALALDERRGKFSACRFEENEPSELPRSDPGSTSDLKGNKPDIKMNGSLTKQYSLHRHSRSDPGTYNHDVVVHPDFSESDIGMRKHVNFHKPFQTDCLDVWFAGCHADVGGGAVPNENRHKLSNIPLRWMIRQCFETNSGIVFNTKKLVEMGLDVHMLWPKYHKLDPPILGPPPSLLEQHEHGFPALIRRSSSLTLVKPGLKKDEFYSFKIVDGDSNGTAVDWIPEQMEDYFDALAPLNDRLDQVKQWWILEFWPVKYIVLNPTSNCWEEKFGMNMGRPRPVMGSEPNLHWTVRQRMLNADYKHRAIMEKDAFWRIVA